MIHAIDVAITQLGVFETNGHNDGIPADRYMRGDKLAWCAGFVLWCYDVSDDPPVWDDDNKATTDDAKRYYALRKVSTMLEWAHTMRVFIEPRVLPARNDVILYGSRAGSDAGAGNHTGIVERIDGGRIHTVEGNLGDAVRRRSVSIDDRTILGFARFARASPAA